MKGLPRLLFAVAAALVLSVPAFAQGTLRGKVTDQDGAPLPGVTVLVKGTSQGTMTGADGTYSMQASKGSVIEFSCLGLATQEHTFDGRNPINVQMTEDALYLDDVVVVGYGTAKKETLTAAVSAIKGDELLKAPATNVSQVLAGVNMMVGGWSAPGIKHGMVYEHPERQEWCAVDLKKDGSLLNHSQDASTLGGRFLDPANPAVQEFLLSMLRDLASYKGLDGIVMDRCRYDDYAMDAGYTAEALRQFTEYIGHEPERWPVFSEPGHIFLDKEPDTIETQWLTFRCKVIHDFVARAADTVHAVRKDLPIGVYVGAWFSEYYRSGVNWTSPSYNLAKEEPTFSWATPEYQATGFANLLDFMFLGAYCPAANVHGDTEKTMEGYAKLGRKRLCGDVPFCAGPDIGNEKGFEKGGQGALLPEIKETIMKEADGFFLFDLCHIRMFDYWDSLR